MYNEVKLEKGMYHLAGKTFAQALEEQDPQNQYAQTPLAKLDAYQRQLKRFDIRVSGAGCDRVEKFFTTTESAVLFPEFVRRAVVQGMQEAVLSDMTAVVSRSESNRYQGCELTDTEDYTITAAGGEMPASAIMESAEVVVLEKYGRVIHASYEAVRQQRLDVFALMLRRIGRQLAESVVKKAVSVLKTAAQGDAVSVSGDALAYADLAALYGKFTGCNMTTLLASPAVMAKILVMEQMLEASSAQVTEIRLPFGAKLVKCAQMDDSAVIGLDKDFALEQIQSSDVVLETDKLIDRQLDCIAVSVNIGFRPLIPEAVKMLNLA